MFAEPHFGQNFLLPKALSIDFLKSHFCFHKLSSSLNLNSLACSPHNGQCCLGWSSLSYGHLVFGQVHEVMFTHHQKLSQSQTCICYQPCLMIDGGIVSFFRFLCFSTSLNLLILTTLPFSETQYSFIRFRW